MAMSLSATWADCRIAQASLPIIRAGCGIAQASLPPTRADFPPETSPLEAPDPTGGNPLG